MFSGKGSRSSLARSRAKSGNVPRNRVRGVKDASWANRRLRRVEIPARQTKDAACRLHLNDVPSRTSTEKTLANHR
jgi:hypothetical protein